MPITFTPQDDSPVCKGHNWTILDEDLLIKILARLVTGYHRHIVTILKDATLPLPPGQALSLSMLEKKLGPPTSDATRYHRDGWIFQQISWIAAQMTANTRVLIAPPQPRTADKGFDGLIVEFKDTGDALEGVIVCEDKATEHGRETVTNKVWPELIDFERGARDAELQSEVTALLNGVPGDVLKMVETIHWNEQRKYRVSVVVSKAEDKLGGRKRMFKGYNTTVTGDTSRRQAEYVVIGDVREWMDKICAGVLKELNAMPKVKHV
jgi:hypothetical protein